MEVLETHCAPVGRFKKANQSNATVENMSYVT